VCYFNAWGIPEDKAEAVKWFRKAAKQGHAHAAQMLEVKPSELVESADNA